MTTETKTRTLSFSSISTYLTCSLKWFYRYEQRIEAPYTGESLLLGNCLHQSIAGFLETVKYKGSLTNVVELQNNFCRILKHETARKPVKYNKGSSPEKLRRTGMNLLNCWLAGFRKDLPHITDIIAIEEKFSLDVVGQECGPFKLTGAIDAVLSCSSWPATAFAPDIRERKFPLIIAVDFKSSASKWAEWRIQNDLQNDAYYFALKRMNLVPERYHDRILMAYGCMIKRLHPTYELYISRRTKESEARFLRIASWVATCLDLQIFFPSPNAISCPSCEYADLCKDWR